MKVLIAEDDPISSRLLETRLVKWGYEVEKTIHGRAALEAMRLKNAPRLAILDWMMPEMDGVEVCKIIRKENTQMPPYIILLTAKARKDNIVEGLDAGADDYLVKPFHDGELRARVQVGVRVVGLQDELARRIGQLQDALTNVKQLQGLIPICSYCKKIRDDKAFWHRVEDYISSHTDAEFSHGICPECYDNNIKPEIDRLKKEKGLL